MIGKVATQRDRQESLEHFKEYFCRALGITHVHSSDESWAETDLRSYMGQAENAPLFIEAFYDACQAFKRRNRAHVAPDANMINRVLARYIRSTLT